MKGPRLARWQRRQRAYAGSEGDKAVRAILHACVAAEDDTAFFWTTFAVLYAQAAWRYALQSEKHDA